MKLFTVATIFAVTVIAAPLASNPVQHVRSELGGKTNPSTIQAKREDVSGDLGETLEDLLDDIFGRSLKGALKRSSDKLSAVKRAGVTGDLGTTLDDLLDAVFGGSDSDSEGKSDKGSSDKGSDTGSAGADKTANPFGIPLPPPFIPIKREDVSGDLGETLEDLLDDIFGRSLKRASKRSAEKLRRAGVTGDLGTTLDDLLDAVFGGSDADSEGKSDKGSSDKGSDTGSAGADKTANPFGIPLPPPFIPIKQ